MIRSFADPRIEKFFRHGICPAKWYAFEKVAKRKLDMLDAAARLSDGNRLEALSGDRQGQYSMRINDQFRICFRWTDNGPVDVEIVDRH